MKRVLLMDFLLLGVVLSVSLVGLASAQPPQSPAEVGGGRPVEGGPDIDGNLVAGHRLCFDCHRSEVLAWQASKHASDVFDLLRDKNAEDYAKALDIRVADIASSSMCVKCHGTPRQDAGRHKPISGVSCEACHNPSGGADGWLNAHAVYGPQGTSREQESEEHFQARTEKCRGAGQIRSADLYAMAKRCYECHLVGDEQLVNETSHRIFDTGFELLQGMLGDVRHNFHLNQRENALVASLWMRDPRSGAQVRTDDGRQRSVYVVGQLVAAEMILRNAVRVTDPDGAFVAGLGAELFSALDNLDALELEDLEDLVGDIEELAGRLEDRDIDPDDMTEFTEAADGLQELAMEIAAGDGSEVEDVELPDISEEHLNGAYHP